LEYQVGQKIVHAAHGVGAIVGVEEQELVEGYSRYYVIHFADKELTVRMPFRQARAVGLRGLMPKTKINQVMATLQALPKQLPQDFKARRKRLEELIFSGAPVKIAEAVRELTWRGVSKSLSLEDKRLLTQGRELLIQEIALASDHEPTAVQEAVDEALSSGVEAKEARQAHDGMAAD
jgi:CarD family transcriptional regulator